MSRNNDWKKNYWDKLTKWGKIWHVIKVILSLIAVTVMFGVFVYFVLFVMGLGHLVEVLRDKILLDIMHILFK